MDARLDPEDERARAAVHEAGHFLVATRWPCAALELRAITIAVDALHSGRVVCRNRHRFDRVEALALCRILVAGYEAEKLLTGRIEPAVARTDLAQARDLFAQLGDGDTSRVITSSRSCHLAVRALLRRDWSALTRLAAELLRATTLSTEAARAIVAAVDGAASPRRAAWPGLMS